jgi:hypothetical protein
MGFSASTKVYFGPHHLGSAAFFSRQAKVFQETEQENELISCVTSAIMLSAFSLEAMINELILDAFDGAKGGAAANLTVEATAALRLEHKIVKWSSTLKKLKHVLSILNLQPYVENQQPYESV